MKNLENIVAEKLLEIKAIKVQPSNPFTWASGWKSPIYCDNRKTLSYPGLRTFIKIELARLIWEKYGQVDVIAGVATGAIAQGAMIADELGLSTNTVKWHKNNIFKKMNVNSTPEMLNFCAKTGFYS